MASSLDQAGPTPAKIILKQSTGMSLNDRFTMLNKSSRGPQPSATATATAQPAISLQANSGALTSRVQRAQIVRSAQQVAREHVLMSRRLPQTAATPNSGLQTAQRLKDRSLKSRLGVASGGSNVKQRLGAVAQRGPVSPSARGPPPPRGGSQPLPVRQIPRFRPARPTLSGRQGGGAIRDRLGSAPTPTHSAPAPAPVGGRRGGVVTPHPQRRSAGGAESGRRMLRGRGPVGLRGRLGGRARGPASSYGGFDTTAQPAPLLAPVSQRGRQHRPGGRLTGRKSESDQQTLSKDELDKQLDAYMNKSKAQLDSQLDTYMAHASGNANANAMQQ